MTEISGILIIDKEAGLTSAGVVAAVRRIFGMRRVGHTGTLDPFATGVLPVCLGRATAAAAYMSGWDKSYRCEVLLGYSTDTMDREGEILEVTPPDLCRALLEEGQSARLQAAVESLILEKSQQAPLYSAVKIAGKPLYRYAREGQSVERPVRPIQVYESRLVGLHESADGYPILTLDLTVSSGTYIRSLADLLARRLGVRGHASSLRRMSAGPYDQAQAAPLDDPAIRERVLPVGSAFIDWPSMDLTREEALDLSHGRTIGCEAGRLQPASGGSRSQAEGLAFFHKQDLVAVGREEDGRCRVKRVFISPLDLDR